MDFFSPACWPLWILSVAMIVMAIIDGWKLKVPNVLTFPLIVSGWFLGLLHNLEWLSVTDGGLGASLAGTFLGLLLLLPIYAIGGMGAGDVKMQMGFGAWIGAFFGLWKGLNIIIIAFAAAVIIGGVIASAMILVRGQFRQNALNTREIVGDLFNAGSVGAVADKAAQRKPRLQLLPYGIPLCIGFVGYLFFHFAVTGNP